MLFSVVFSVVLTVACGLPMKKIHQSAEFDHYVFTQEYPAGSCYCYNAEGKGYDCFYPQNASSWTIHGLWPTEGTSRSPNFCKKTTFDPDVIQSLLPQLMVDWPNLLNNTGFYSFWSHEYVKHGTCTGLGEYDFFNEVLGLFKKIGCFGDALSRGNVVPDDQSTYDADKLRSVLASAYGVTPTLQCRRVKGDSIMQQIELCLTKEDFTPMECPDRMKADSCPDQVFYPPSIYSQN